MTESVKRLVEAAEESITRCGCVVRMPAGYCVRCEWLREAISGLDAVRAEHPAEPREPERNHCGHVGPTAYSVCADCFHVSLKKASEQPSEPRCASCNKPLPVACPDCTAYAVESVRVPTCGHGAPGESLASQVARLAAFILAECPGYPKEGGAIDTAMQIIRDGADLMEAAAEMLENEAYEEHHIGQNPDRYSERGDGMMDIAARLRGAR